jgi:hypothetical protein
LWSCFSNDFPSILNSVAHTILYADDTTIIVSSNDSNTLNHNCMYICICKELLGPDCTLQFSFDCDEFNIRSGLPDNGLVKLCSYVCMYI